MNKQLSEKQLQANQKNALLGGVKTPDGKNISKYNAIKHGFLCKQVLLHGEDEESLVQLQKGLRENFKPQGQFELILVDRIGSNLWRLKRTLEIETNLMEFHHDDIIHDSFSFLSEPQKERKAQIRMISNEDLDKIVRYETMLERSIFRSLHELQRIQSTRTGINTPLPVAIDINLDDQ